MADYDYDISPDGEEDFYPDFYPDNYALNEDDKLSPWNEQEGLPPMSLFQLYHSCIYPTINDGLNHIFKAVAWCIIYRITTQTVNIPKQLCHVASIACGSMVMYHFFGYYLFYMLAQGMIAYLSLVISSSGSKNISGWMCMFVCITFLLLCELFIVDAMHWHMIRAAQMLVAMRAISIGFQLDEKILASLPKPLPYFGYLFNVGTVSFGPWIPFKDYMNIEANNRSLLRCFINILRAFILSLIFLTISACFTLWLIPSGSSKWLLAYRDAMSFRSSHYFVSYLSELTALAAGIDTSTTERWTVTVTRPWHIELPRSLVEVVIHWNVPMHTWLKTYVFRVARPYGTFFAIIGTYGLSALLHGLNFQLAAVLLSLGFYTYTEHATRQKLASIFSACIQARKCGSNCGHQWKENHWAVRICNFSFSLLAVFHLAYLGLMFDSSKLQEEGYNWLHAIKKWRWLNFSSHWIVLGTFGFNYLI
ncbi:protein-serine O-palmitoleoyltransferase porcupine-like [Daphnia pulex]|uniref:protein-serine O-palmitoleoyltransferase porcupine-like n=1 Tax=Daphnia pulex TaxID=6669 RepID=UPI001EDF2B42|nr:protein-serine O-palmitoleoyltransferase porcupine-like [Daphnia pulex]